MKKKRKKGDVPETSKYKSLEEWRKACPEYYEAAKERGMLLAIAKKFNWLLPEEKQETLTEPLEIKYSADYVYEKYTIKGLGRKGNKEHRAKTRRLLYENLHKIVKLASYIGVDVYIIGESLCLFLEFRKDGYKFNQMVGTKFTPISGWESVKAYDEKYIAEVNKTLDDLKLRRQIIEN